MASSAHEAANEQDRLMLRQRPFLVETLTAIGLLLAPIVLPYLGFAPNTVNRILVWGLFGIGFDILFGYTGLLSFGQSAFYGTGGFVAAYLLTRTGFSYVVLALIIGMVAAGAVGYLVGLIALRRTGIYFAMITVVSLSVHRGLLLRRHRHRIAHCTFAGRRHSPRNPRQPVACSRSRPQHPRLQARGLRDRRSLCRLCRRAARRDAGFHAAGRLHVRDVRATGDADRNRWYRHAVRSAARRCGVVVSAGFSAGRARTRRDL